MSEPKLRFVAEGISKSLGFALGEFAGSGSFKETYRAVTASEEQVALKVFDPTRSDLARAERELEAMRQCNSPRVARLQLWGIHESEDKRYVYTTEEYFENGTLTDHLDGDTMPAAEVRQLGLALAEALAELEPRGLVHRDIKPDNIMFRSGDPLAVLVDFGLVRDTSRSSLTPTFLPSGPGTPMFASPEQLNNDKHLIDWRTDQFCMGVVLGLCLSGRHPFRSEGMTDGQVVGLVAERGRCPEVFAELAAGEGLDAITRMVELWPVKRFATPAALIEALVEATSG